MRPAPTHYEPHFNGNALLSDQAQREARLLLLDAEEQIPMLDIKLFNTPIEDSLALKMQRAAVIDRTRLYRAAIAPHRAIPNEILSEIFALCADVVRVPINLAAPPWTLARVCSRWKKVVMGTPSLWSKVEVNYERGNAHDVNRTLKAHEILSRCRGSVSVKIVGDIFETEPMPVIQYMNELVLPRSTRLAGVTLKCLLEFGSSFFQLPPGSLHLVDTLDLSFGGPYYPAGDVAIFQNESRLRNIFIDGGNYSSLRPCSYKFPWSQLTNICIVNAAISTYDAHLMLQLCMQLSQCRLPIRKSYSDTQELSLLKGLPPTRLPHLTSLLIESISGLGEFLHGLDLPGLVDLETFHQRGFRSAEACSEGEWRDEFVPFLRRIHELKRLCIRQLVPETIIEHILRAAPSIVTFALQEGDELPYDVLELIGIGGLVPKVEDICCYVVQLGPFLDMVEYRGWGPIPCSQFKEVFIDLDTQYEGTDYSSRQRVESLKMAGYNIMIRG